MGVHRVARTLMAFSVVPSAGDLAEGEEVRLTQRVQIFIDGPRPEGTGELLITTQCARAAAFTLYYTAACTRS